MSKKHTLKVSNKKGAAKEEEWPKSIQATSVDQVERLLNRPYGKPKVLSLNVSGQHLGDDLSGRIGKHMINNGKGLEELQLSENNLTPKTGERLAKGLVNSRTILILNLSQNSLGDRGAALLCKSLQSNLTLHTLNLSSNNIGSHSSHTSGCSGVTSMTASTPPTITKSDWIVQLSTFLKVHKKLRHLNLADNLFGYKDVETMCESFHSPTCQLTNLNLSLNPIGDLGMECLSLTLGSTSNALPHLKTLKLTSINTGKLGIETLGKAFRCEGLSQVEVLWIDNNPDIGPEGMISFLNDAFCRNKLCHIVEFKMGGTMCSYNSTAALPRPKTRPFVETYSDEKNGLHGGKSGKEKTSEDVGKGLKEGKESKESKEGKEGKEIDQLVAQLVKELIEQVIIEQETKEQEEKEPHEDELSSQESSLKEEDKKSNITVWTTLGRAISMNKTLVTLDICEELSMGDDACADLVSGLLQNVSIQHLILEGSNIQDEGAALISDVLVEQNILTNLNLRRNKINDEGGAAIAESLIDNSTLLSIDLAHNSMDTEGVMSFAAMLKTNRTLTSLDLRGNGLVDNARRTKVVATDGFARAVVKATIYNMKPAILHLPGAQLGRVATACRLPKEMFDQHSTNEEILKHAHTMEL